MEIVYEDEEMIAVNKPPGVFVHRTSMDPEAKVFVVQTVRDLIGQRVYPVHRLDRKTSGLLLLAKSKAIQSLLNATIRERAIEKRYLAIVRGYTPDAGIIDYALLSENGKLQEAVTAYHTLEKTELPVSSGTFPTSRYSLLDLNPQTGRTHQLRRHLAHIFHPIIGDRPHGCNKQNKFFLQHFGMNSMMLHASTMTFLHPKSNAEMTIKAPVFGDFERMVRELGFSCLDDTAGGLD